MINSAIICFAPLGLFDRFCARTQGGARSSLALGWLVEGPLARSAGHVSGQESRSFARSAVSSGEFLSSPAGCRRRHAGVRYQIFDCEILRSGKRKKDVAGVVVFGNWFRCVTKNPTE